MRKAVEIKEENIIWFFSIGGIKEIFFFFDWRTFTTWNILYVIQYKSLNNFTLLFVTDAKYTDAKYFFEIVLKLWYELIWSIEYLIAHFHKLSRNFDNTRRE